MYKDHLFCLKYNILMQDFYLLTIFKIRDPIYSYTEKWNNA